MNGAFEFATAGRIVFGLGRLREIGALTRELGRRALVVTGRDQERVGPLLEHLKTAGLEWSLFPVPGEPAVETVQRGTASAREARCDMVIAFGGGSAIDAGKAVAAMLANEGELLDFLEVIGGGRSLAKPSAPFVAIPTTAGTGSEVTRNAVLASPEHGVKVSLRSPLMLARVALIDPELTYSLPPAVTVASGLDALTQLIEPYVCSRINPMTDALCLEGIRRAARALPIVYSNGRDPGARYDMSVASLFGGLALANAGLGAVHGFAGPIGGMFGAPHGAICAALLSYVMEINVQALRQRQPAADTLARYETVATLLTGDTSASPEDGVRWAERLVGELKIPRLGVYGISAQVLDELVEKSSRASSMKANPIVLTRQEMREVLGRAL